MLALLAPLFSHGVIDNTVRDSIVLRLWGADGGEPIELALRGNCLRDIAGCRVSWESQEAAAHLEPGEHPVLQRLRGPLPELTAGDITLSRRVPEQDNRRRMMNLLSIEFFVGQEHRVLIELGSFTYDLSLPQWEMTWEEENAQSFLNMEALRRHVAYNTERFCGPAMADIRDTGFPPCVWDSRLNHAEARMAIYSSVHEKYAYQPDGELSEAYVMDRAELLAHRAAEDEAHLPPEPLRERRSWEVLDFIDPAYTADVRRAMRHPLFADTSHLTAMVQKRLLRNDEARGEATEAFVGRYAAFVSQLLATLLLARQERFPLELAQRRLQLLSERLHALIEMGRRLPMDSMEEVLLAADALQAKLGVFATGLSN